MKPSVLWTLTCLVCQWLWMFFLCFLAYRFLPPFLFSLFWVSTHFLRDLSYSQGNSHANLNLLPRYLYIFLIRHYHLKLIWINIYTSFSYPPHQNEQLFFPNTAFISGCAMCFFVESYKIQIYSIVLEEMESQSIQGLLCFLGVHLSSRGFIELPCHEERNPCPCYYLSMLASPETSRILSLALRDQSMHFAAEQTLICIC